jgi:hypothetical protein
MAPLSPFGSGIIVGLENGSAAVWCFETARAASATVVSDFEGAARARAIALAAEDEFSAVQATGAGAAASGAAAGSGAGGAAASAYSINFPVEFPGRPPMQVSWNPGEPAETVAERFVSENGLGAEHATTPGSRSICHKRSPEQG